MRAFELAQAFIELCGVQPPSPELAVAFEATLERLGFRHFACCSHVDPMHVPDGAIFIHNYPQEWIREFSERKLYEIDPILRHAERCLVPFSWDAPDFQRHIAGPQQEILRQAASFGLTRGFTVPIHLPCAPGAPRASCSVVPDSISIDQHNYLAVQVMATHMYSASTRDLGSGPLRTVLTVRQRQCLELAAHGKDDWTIGQLMHLSEHTVHRYLERAKRRLGVATRIQAVVCALQRREISFGDVVRAETVLDPALDAAGDPQSEADLT